jgi:ligand-binding SRPBCC domain-containing protein
VAHIEIVTRIEAAPERCFDVARDLDVHLRTMTQTAEKAVAGRTSGLIELGEEVTWEGRHFGLVHRHTSRITHFDRPRHFCDAMVRGRFASFRHDHYFDPDGSGTLMRDVIEFRSPLGVIGRVVDALVLTAYMTRLVTRRNAGVKQVAETGL